MSKTALTTYDKARSAIQACVRLDEAAEIANQADALRTYARQRDDVEMECWVCEIRVRAVVRIGEISAGLDTDRERGVDGRLLPTSGKLAKSAALKDAGISTSAANRYEKLAHKDARGKLDAYIAKKRAQHKPIKITEAIAAVESEAREAKSREVLLRSSEELPDLVLGDFRANALPDECAQIVFTDPPYDAKSAALFGAAAKEAARILRPGGSFIAYCGQTQLPDVLVACREHLRYWWTIACVHSGGAGQIRRYGIKNLWKPMVWFVKESRGDVKTFVDDAMSGGREKSHHAWQQAEAEAAYYIERLTSKDGLVVDFFAGGGTTLVAAKRLGRKWYGCEIDPVARAQAANRISELREAA